MVKVIKGCLLTAPIGDTPPPFKVRFHFKSPRALSPPAFTAALVPEAKGAQKDDRNVPSPGVQERSQLCLQSAELWACSAEWAGPAMLPKG